MFQRTSVALVLLALVSTAAPVFAQQNADDRLRRDARRFGVGVVGGVGLDPELIDVGAHATFGPVFKPDLLFRPGLEIGAGEVTTFLGVNLECAECHNHPLAEWKQTDYWGMAAFFSRVRGTAGKKTNVSEMELKKPVKTRARPMAQSSSRIGTRIMGTSMVTGLLRSTGAAGRVTITAGFTSLASLLRAFCGRRPTRK